MNVVLLAGWLLHYLYRGIVHPLIMPYSSKTVAVGITLAGIFPNLLFSYLIAAQLACTNYPSDWASQPRFVIGAVLYGIGTVINRWADLKLRAGRLAMGKHRHYFIPRGGLYELVSCPNYLGELLEWTGYALAVWSWPALAWALFGASTFIPRSLTNHRWYKEHFGSDYPAGRRALVPFVL
ncbi:hypothetical protein VOLCADRAFT_54973 [Volvox carteri f. nagariensis]|uniref:3-oxo-5-alpha-steroid 4-dehydrogenase C-terminal domain-containing protein n=1 Tax=Volvox carteri f. nagariensis TaxID=3068 RepID=D8TGX4_VOLCA|nr:uncharacterized protein VOLCADRAFT_54973 [Volvox carteri f. nagariensis]EFJ52608.1 hypothetical protein VOLCADRAFT_54973 [Volvox carteri f. nagariensis]|eukprot:XP_002945613.1 hypothetical protein VOLCADRAFT_54973 [Volvox carteri f. nagariensis]